MWEATSEIEEGFTRLKTYFQEAHVQLTKCGLLTKSSEFSQTVQTPPLLVIPRKQSRTAACRGSPTLTTKSLLKNRKDKAYLGNRLCSFRLFCRHNGWNNNAGGEHLVGHTSCETNSPFPSTGESRTPSPEEPQLLCYYKEWAVYSSEMDPIPELCSVCKSTHFEFHRSQGCLLGTSGGTRPASGCSVLTWGSSLLISGNGFMEHSL